MIANIPWLHSPLNFLLNTILIRCGCSRIFELFHTFTGTVINLYVVNSTSILILRHDHVLSFISFYFCLILLTAWSQLAARTSEVLRPSSRTSRKLPNINDMFYSKVNSAVWFWSRCFPKWHCHFELHIIWSAGTVESWGTQPLGNSSSLQKEWCCEWQRRACVRTHREAMGFRFFIPHILVLALQRCSTPQV